jgi:predicted kinase
MNIPKLIVVTGRPGAGKTTLAHMLARTVRCPALCRDEFKEGFVNTFHRDAQLDDRANLEVYETFFEAIELLLRNRITLVAEAAFQHKRWIPKLEPLRQIAHIRIVICWIDPELAQARIIQRAHIEPERERYHQEHVPPSVLSSEIPISPYDPPRLSVPTLAVNTSQGYQPQFESIVEFAMQLEGNAD